MHRTNSFIPVGSVYRIRANGRSAKRAVRSDAVRRLYSSLPRTLPICSYEHTTNKITAVGKLSDKRKVAGSSDIDVAVVVDKTSGDYFETRPILWKISRQVDDRIEPLILEIKHDESGFLAEVMKSGIVT